MAERSLARELNAVLSSYQGVSSFSLDHLLNDLGLVKTSQTMVPIDAGNLEIRLSSELDWDLFRGNMHTLFMAINNVHISAKSAKRKSHQKLSPEDIDHI